MMLLDTNVFNNRKLLDWIREKDSEAYVSSISVMELVYHHLKKGTPEGYTLAVLEGLGIKIVDFDYNAALQGAKSAVGRWDFKERAPDYAILGIAKTMNATLVTENKGHFPYEKVRTPKEVMKRG
jgi:predicted nucleic acid-binding protein